ALEGGQLVGGEAVADRDAALLERVLDEVERGPADADGARRDDRASGVEGGHHALEALARLRDLGAAQDVGERHAAVLEDERRRVRGPDAELVLYLGDVHAGRPRLDHEGLDAGPAGRAVER